MNIDKLQAPKRIPRLAIILKRSNKNLGWITFAILAILVVSDMAPDKLSLHC